MARFNDYMLAVGEETRERLKLLGDVYNPLSLRFLRSLPIQDPQHVLDVGCGFGNMTVPLAKDLYPNAQVVGVDFSEEQIAIAQEYSQGMDNITYHAMPAEDIGQLNRQFDVIYCRFLLMHLPHYQHVLDAMLAQLAPGGYLVCEESSDIDNAFVYPKCQALSDVRANFQCVRENAGKTQDFTFGRKLPGILHALGLQYVTGMISQPLLTTEREKSLMRLSHREFLVTATGKASDMVRAYDQYVPAIKQAEQDPQTVAGTLSMAQVCVRK